MLPLLRALCSVIACSVLACVVLALAAPAGATPLDDARQAHEAAGAALTRVEQARAELDVSHERIAAEIEALKAGRGPLLPGVSDPRLDRKLKQAGALAAQLSAYDRDAAAAREALGRAREALLGVIDAELARRRLALAEAPAVERRALFEGLRGLITERHAVAAQVAAVEVAPQPALPAPTADPFASPDELRELADETRDHAEQVRRQLSMIESRLDGLRERQRLTRAAMAFQRDGALFAQDERNRTVVQAPSNPRVAVAERGDLPPPTRDANGSPTLDGMAAADEGAERAPDPDADQADAPAQSPDGAEGDDDGFRGDGEQGGDDGAFDFAEGGAADPEAGAVVDPAPPALAPGGEVVDGPIIGGDAARLGEAFDPELLAGDVDELSPGAVARQIEALQRRKAELAAAREALRARQRSLEDRAVEMEQE